MELLTVLERKVNYIVKDLKILANETEIVKKIREYPGSCCDDIESSMKATAAEAIG